LIVENSEFLSVDNPIDPNGKAVAIVDIEEIHEWQPSKVAEAAQVAGSLVIGLGACRMFVPLQLSNLYQLRESCMRLTSRTLKPNRGFKPFASPAGTG